MNIKPVVKVMNFHSLLRVDAARKSAEKYRAMEDELASMIFIIYNNENLRLDKKIKRPNPLAPALNIYIGSDMGFCGGINSYVSSEYASGGGTKIAVGRKIRGAKNANLYIQQEDFKERFYLISKYLEAAVTKGKWSKVNLIYNKFCDVSTIKPVNITIFPMEIPKVDIKGSKWDDFDFEGINGDFLSKLFLTYLEYEVKIAMANSYASENIMRQNATTESLKKLDELEAEELRIQRKERTEQSFKKTIDSFIKQKAINAG